LSGLSLSKKRFLNITPDDIYNFDESGFAMGVSATTKVITQPFRTGRRGVLQAGNREWVTVIESICASGRALPPYIIFKGKNFMVRWFDSLPKHWALEGLSGNAKQVLSIYLRDLEPAKVGGSGHEYNFGGCCPKKSSTHISTTCWIREFLGISQTLSLGRFLLITLYRGPR
jgi:hypothetical protein